MRILPKTLKHLVEKLLIALGILENDAEKVSEVYVRASRRGVGHHDISYLPQRLDWLKSGKISSDNRIKLISDLPSAKIFEAGNSLGELVCQKLTQEAGELALINGIGIASARNSNHFLAAEPYVEILAEKGLMGLIWSNTDPCMSGPSGKSLVIGNNPMGFGSPSFNTPFLLDICMAYASLGTLKKLSSGKVPNHWGRDAFGQPALSAPAILEGGVTHPIGGHKGYSLALMHEFLTAGLTGGRWGAESEPLSGGIGNHSQTVVAIKLPFGAEDLSLRAKNLDAVLKQRDSSLRFPGSVSTLEGRTAEKEGIEITEETRRSLDEWCKTLGVLFPEGQ